MMRVSLLLSFSPTFIISSFFPRGAYAPPADVLFSLGTSHLFFFHHVSTIWFHHQLEEEQRERDRLHGFEDKSYFFEEKRPLSPFFSFVLPVSLWMLKAGLSDLALPRCGC
jgi:hypothetical protein